MRHHLARVHQQHEGDLARGLGGVALPDKLEGKYSGAPFEWPWQWVFPATRFYLHVPTGTRRRHHIHESVQQRAFKQAEICLHVLDRGGRGVCSPLDGLL